jgi:hypothetical protein
VAATIVRFCGFVFHKPTTSSRNCLKQMALSGLSGSLRELLMDVNKLGERQDNLVWA